VSFGIKTAPFLIDFHFKSALLIYLEYAYNRLSDITIIIKQWKTIVSPLPLAGEGKGEGGLGIFPPHLCPLPKGRGNNRSALLN
jgi:hypothetical protein